MSQKVTSRLGNTPKKSCLFGVTFQLYYRKRGVLPWCFLLLQLNWTKTHTISSTFQGNLQVTPQGVTWRLPSVTWLTVFSVYISLVKIDLPKQVMGLDCVYQIVLLTKMSARENVKWNIRNSRFWLGFDNREKRNFSQP